MKRIKKLWLYFFILKTFCFIYGFKEPENIEVIHFCRTPCIQSELKGKTAIHLSDIHTAGIGSNENGCKDLDEIKPDFIFLTGDYVEVGWDYEPAMRFLPV